MFCLIMCFVLLHVRGFHAMISYLKRNRDITCRTLWLPLADRVLGPLCLMAPTLTSLVVCDWSYMTDKFYHSGSILCAGWWSYADHCRTSPRIRKYIFNVWYKRHLVQSYPIFYMPVMMITREDLRMLSCYWFWWRWQESDGKFVGFSDEPHLVFEILKFLLEMFLFDIAGLQSLDGQLYFLPKGGHLREFTDEESNFAALLQRAMDLDGVDRETLHHLVTLLMKVGHDKQVIIMHAFVDSHFKYLFAYLDLFSSSWWMLIRITSAKIVIWVKLKWVQCSSQNWWISL